VSEQRQAAVPADKRPAGPLLAALDGFQKEPVVVADELLVDRAPRISTDRGTTEYVAARATNSSRLRLGFIERG
jgi:hypothetical protein